MRSERARVFVAVSFASAIGFGLLGACGGRSAIEESCDDAAAIDAASDVLIPDATAIDAQSEAAPPPVDAAPDAFVFVDAGNGICPNPPLLTATGTPRTALLEQLALGNEHTCLLTDGEVWCWGKNIDGELGDGTQAARARPTRVSGIANAVQIGSGPAFDVGCDAVRGSHTCALLNDGTVTCWGSNVSGDDSWFVESFVPESIPGLANVSSLAVAGYNNCALLADGSSSCFGVATTPVPDVDSGLRFDVYTEIAAGAGIMGRRTDGTAWTWTSSTNKGITTVTTPMVVSGLSSVTHVAVGWSQSCALKSDGTIWCWGYNYHGELGDGTYTNRANPVQVLGISSAVAIAAGGRTTCAILSDGSLMCWGDNTYGQMGIGSSGGAQPTPAAVPGLSNVYEIRGGLDHLCAILSDASVWCWGGNETGQVGDGTTIERDSPVQVYP